MPQSPPPAAPQIQKHLYVMTIAELPGRFKIGRTHDIAKRRKQTDIGNFFTVCLAASYENAGHHEMQIRDLLAPSRINCDGNREWFKLSLEHMQQHPRAIDVETRC